MIKFNDGLVFWSELFVTNCAFFTDALVLHPFKTVFQWFVIFLVLSWQCTGFTANCAALLQDPTVKT